MDGLRWQHSKLSNDNTLDYEYYMRQHQPWNVETLDGSISLQFSRSRLPVSTVPWVSGHGSSSSQCKLARITSQTTIERRFSSHYTHMHTKKRTYLPTTSHLTNIWLLHRSMHTDYNRAMLVKTDSVIHKTTCSVKGCSVTYYWVHNNSHLRRNTTKL